MKPIQPGMKVHMSDGGTATVTDVLIDPRDAGERYVVLSAHGYFGPDVVAPAAAVWLVDDHVHVALTCAELETLPPFEAGAYLEQEGLCSRAASQHGPHHHHAPSERR